MSKCIITKTRLFEQEWRNLISVLSADPNFNHIKALNDAVAKYITVAGETEILIVKLDDICCEITLKCGKNASSQIRVDMQSIKKIPDTQQPHMEIKLSIR